MIMEDNASPQLYDTALHTAVKSDDINLVRELIRNHEGLTKKLNQEFLSPLHVAVTEGKSHIARQMVDHDENLIRLEGKEGCTPLHYSALRGKEGFLELFLEACPDSIYDLNDKHETVIHTAIGDPNPHAFQTLLRWVRTRRKDGILETENIQGRTAWDLIAENEIFKSIWQEELGFVGNDNAMHLTAAVGVIFRMCWQRLGRGQLTDKIRDSCLAVASALSMATFQALFQSSGGVPGSKIDSRSHHPQRNSWKIIFLSTNALVFFISLTACLVFTSSPDTKTNLIDVVCFYSFGIAYLLAQHCIANVGIRITVLLMLIFVLITLPLWVPFRCRCRRRFCRIEIPTVCREFFERLDRRYRVMNAVSTVP